MDSEITFVLVYIVKCLDFLRNWGWFLFYFILFQGCYLKYVTGINIREREREKKGDMEIINAKIPISFSLSVCLLPPSHPLKSVYLQKQMKRSGPDVKLPDMLEALWTKLWIPSCPIASNTRSLLHLFTTLLHSQSYHRHTASTDTNRLFFIILGTFQYFQHFHRYMTAVLVQSKQMYKQPVVVDVCKCVYYICGYKIIITSICNENPVDSHISIRYSRGY